MNANQIIRRPLVTEKSTTLREEGNVITFEVDPSGKSVSGVTGSCSSTSR